MELIEQIGMVLLVLSLLGGLVWFAKTRGLGSIRIAPRSGNRRRMEVLERVSLGTHHALLLVRVADKVVLIGTAPSACTLLETSLPHESQAAPSPGFVLSNQ